MTDENDAVDPNDPRPRERRFRSPFKTLFSGGTFNLPCIGANMNRTSIATVSKETRDAIAAYRDSNDHPNYDSALKALLEEASG